MAEWEYEPPIEAMEPLLFRLRRFAECVALELRGAALVAEKLSLALLLEDDNEHRRDFRLPEPSANVEAWMRVFHAHLENVKAPARVVGVRLIATPARPPEKQDGLFDTGLRDPWLFWENLARVGAIVGDDCVGTPIVQDTWKPDSVALEKPAESVPPPEAEPVHPPRGLTLRRFRPPWPARVDMATERPAAIAAHELHETVREALGPFRLSGGWWKPHDAWRVETWQVETASGAIYQLARGPDGWCVEGVLD
jgi:protein ImuB